MLKPIEHLVKNPNDIPDVPRAVKEYLQSNFNADYLYRSLITHLRAERFSEEFISGVLYGFHKASCVIDDMETRKQLNNEE